MTTAVTVSGLSGSQLQVLKRTIAKELTDVEFDLFMEACRSYQLDPFRRQIIPAIYSANDPKKRSMTLITTRDGLRVIASRQGDYRPASEPPAYEADPALKDKVNSVGLISATVTLFKRDPAGDWYPVTGQAYWDEYVPKFEVFKTQWPKMPRVMLAKCAEAAALRAGWPDAFAGLYVAEEMARAGADDLTASMALAQAEEERRKALIGGSGILIAFDPSKLEKVPTGQMVDRVTEWVTAKGRTDQEVYEFVERNEHGLNEFWATNKGDALALKRLTEPHVEAFLKAPKQVKQTKK